MLQNAQTGAFGFPVQSMWSNPIDEEAAWRKSAILFDQSFHMTELRVTAAPFGPRRLVRPPAWLRGTGRASPGRPCPSS